MIDKNLKKELIVKRRNVKAKLEQLKHGEILQEYMFNPITKHLKNIESTLQSSQIKPIVQSNVNPIEKEEEEEEPVQQVEPIKKIETSDVFSDLSSTRRKRKLTSLHKTPPSQIKQSLIDEVNSDDDDDDDVAFGETSRLQDIADSSFIDYLDQYEPLPRKYINDMYKDVDNKDFDHKYGVRLDTTVEKFMIGDSQMDINGSDVYVKGKRYKGTQGLYELLFKKYPNNALLSDDDIRNYKQIVYKTNAHKRHYKSNSQIDGSKLQKYKNIIATAGGKGFPTPTITTTMMEVTGNKKDYIYWDDPNELVDRLRLLVSSQAAGHTGHTNEINSLIEELREVKIIA